MSGPINYITSYLSVSVKLKSIQTGRWMDVYKKDRISHNVSY